MSVSECFKWYLLAMNCFICRLILLEVFSLPEVLLTKLFGIYTADARSKCSLMLYSAYNFMLLCNYVRVVQTDVALRLLVIIFKMFKAIIQVLQNWLHSVENSCAVAKQCCWFTHYYYFCFYLSLIITRQT